ncbi:response regulator transcription factor [Psychrilyobacter atlanticus]|uniref:response regulator transcription factor n=1 Tax=Psychrilyobacter atlanticus TaxID=271091 RepID=UPI00041EBA66|nr:response regulator transcription factor [Psychrilyobacter atlanticus]
MNVLVLEDSMSTRQLLVSILKKEGYSVSGFSSGTTGLTHLANNPIDFILLDINLPDMNGYEIAGKIKANPKVYGTPYIIILTSKTNAEDVVEGFRNGADDYLKKPFNPEELKLRIKAATRNFMTSQHSYIYKSIIIDPDSQTITYEGKMIKVTKTEFKLLLHFIENKNIVLTRRKIYKNVWDELYFEGNRTIDVYIRRLKIKIPLLNESIETIRGVGYKLNSHTTMGC